jgi:hypothetical protein
MARCSLQQRIAGSLAGTVWMQALDGIGLDQGVRLFAVHQASADVDEMRVMVKATVHLEEPHRGLDIEIKPGGSGETQSAGCAMDDDVGIDTLEDLGGVDWVTELVLDELHFASELVADAVHVPDRGNHGVVRDAGELTEYVVTQGSSAAGDENAPTAKGLRHGLLNQSDKYRAANGFVIPAYV